MSCQACGRDDGHWLGCEVPGPNRHALHVGVAFSADTCEHGECSEPKKAYSGRGAKPKYCEEHSDPKNRK